MLLWYVIGFFCELFLLSILSSRLTALMSKLLHTIFKNQSIMITIMTLLLFPGTVIHELSHLFTAEILGVRTGKLTLVPELSSLSDINKGEKSMRVGGVMVAKTDPFRRTIIGVAPLVVGIAILVVLSYYLPSWWEGLSAALKTHAYTSFPVFRFMFALYGLFAVSNTMFASKEDMKGVWPLIFTLVLLGSAAYLAGIRIGLTPEAIARVEAVLLTLIRAIGIVLIANIIGLLPIKLIVDHQVRLK